MNCHSLKLQLSDIQMVLEISGTRGRYLQRSTWSALWRCSVAGGVLLLLWGGVFMIELSIHGRNFISFFFKEKILNTSLIIHAGYSRKGRLVLTLQSMHYGVGRGEECSS